MYATKTKEQATLNRSEGFSAGKNLRRLSHLDGSTIQKKPASKSPSRQKAVVSQELNQRLDKRGNNIVVTYTGQARQFQGSRDGEGSSTHEDPDFKNVNTYQSEWGFINDGKKEKGDESQEINNFTNKFHSGHILAAKLGGSNKPNNRFLQDGGQNNSNPWVNAENRAKEFFERNSGPVYYRVTLNQDTKSWLKSMWTRNRKIK